MITYVICSLLFISISANIGQIIWHRLNAKKTPQAKPDITACDLLHDLTKSGQAVLKVEVIDMANILLRSPRS